MFANWFGTRKPRPAHRSPLIRPTLEYLENRLAPSGLQPMAGHGHGNGPPDGGPPGGGPPGGGPPGHINNVHINAHDSFNTTIADSFNTSINNIVVNQYFTTINNILIQQSFQTNLFLAAQQNFQATLGLVVNEFQLASDTLASLTGAGGMNNPLLAANMHNLQLGIQQNPLEASPVGESLGSLAFDMALHNATQGHS